MKIEAGLAHDVLRRGKHPFDAFFKPRSVAVIGATEAAGSVGRTVMTNLVATSFGGDVPPSIHDATVCSASRRIRPSVTSRDRSTSRSSSRPPRRSRRSSAVRRCQGSRAPSIISAGFRETGPAGAELERAVLAEGRRGGMRIVGPELSRRHEPGQRPQCDVRRRHGPAGQRRVSQPERRALHGHSRLEPSEKVGFCAFVSIGSMLDVGWGDLIDYFGDDPATRAIVIYMESIGDARALPVGRARGGADKPIIVIKAGRPRPPAGRRLAHRCAHRLDDVLDAAFRRVGVLRVNASTSSSTWPRCSASSRARAGHD